MLERENMNRSKKKYFFYLFGGVLITASICVAAVYGYWAVFNYRFVAVTEGQVYQSAEMPPAKLQEVVQKYGIRSVIDLRKPGEGVDAERAALAQVAVKHFHLPARQIPSHEVIKKYLAILDQPEYRPVLVHCRHGEGRSVLFAAIYRIEYEGWSNERARRAARFISWIGNFRPASKKGKFIREYVPRFRATNNLTFHSPNLHGSK